MRRQRREMAPWPRSGTIGLPADHRPQPSTSGIAGIIEGTTEQAATAGMAICASGAFNSFESAEVLLNDQMNRALKNAAEVAGKYQAPN